VAGPVLPADGGSTSIEGAGDDPAITLRAGSDLAATDVVP
jgi:hypothetical protein